MRLPLPRKQASAEPSFRLRGRWIGVDARDLSGGAGTGVATYSREALRAIASQQGQAELFDACPASIPRPARLLRAALAGLRPPLPTRVQTAAAMEGASRLRIAPDVFRLAQTHFDLWGRVLPCAGDDLPDLMHWTSPLPIRLIGCPNLYTIHDLIPLRRPNLTGTDPARFRRLARAVVAGADWLVAVSEATRRELEREIPESAGRITTLPQAVRLPPLHAMAANVRHSPGGYYVYTGAIEPRKNLAVLLAAHQASNTARPLLLIGPDGWRAREELAPWQARIGPADSDAPVRRLGFVARETQLRLIRDARALLYPSLAEGFGLPILEAMALGVPVLTSRDGATGEVAGGAALLIDPADPAAITQAIRRLDQDDALLAELRARGLARAAVFSPDLYAERLAKLYEDLYMGEDSRSPR